jgi:hypothetical protein
MPPREEAFPTLDQLSTNYGNDWQLIGYTDWLLPVNRGMFCVPQTAKFVVHVPKRSKVGYPDGA